MNDVILEKLNNIENEHKIKIIYSIESGSRGWGFPSMDSDYDVRFVYVKSKYYYLSIDEKPDFIEYPIDHVLDINGWDIKKILLHIKKSNPSILEWFSSPIVYLDKYNFKNSINDVICEYFLKTNAMYHYFHLSFKKFQDNLRSDEIKIKTIFYILRPIFCLMCIEKNNSMPPMEFKKLVDTSDVSDDIKDDIYYLLTVKSKSNEGFFVNKSPVLWKFIKEKINYYENYLKNMEKDTITSYDKLNEIFIRILEEEYNGI